MWIEQDCFIAFFAWCSLKLYLAHIRQTASKKHSASWDARDHEAGWWLACECPGLVSGNLCWVRVRRAWAGLHPHQRNRAGVTGCHWLRGRSRSGGELSGSDSVIKSSSAVWEVNTWLTRCHRDNDKISLDVIVTNIISFTTSLEVF